MKSGTLDGVTSEDEERLDIEILNPCHEDVRPGAVDGKLLG